MQTVGTVIRSARLEAGISLEEISVWTRISLRTLEAIENDDISSMPSAFFYKSFVAQFAKALQIEISTLSPLMETVLTRIPEPLMPGQNERIAKSAVIRRGTRGRSYKWVYSIVSLVLVLVCCSGFYAFWENKKGDFSHFLHRGEDSTNPSTAPGVGQNPASGGGDQSALVEPKDGFRVDLSVLEPTWLTISADGKEEFSGTLERRQKKSFEGHERGRIRTGNAGGISFVFNGRPIGVVGPRGQVRTVVFTKNGYEVLEPARVDIVSFIPTFELMRPLRDYAR